MTTLELLQSIYPNQVSFSAGEIAKILGCHVRSVNRGLAEGTLPLPTFAPTQYRKRVFLADLVEYLDARTLSSCKKRGRPVGSRNRKPKSHD